MRVPTDWAPCNGCNTFEGTYAGELSTLAFVGPDSPNPDQQIYNDDWNNFGPAIGFSYQLPWFGKGKTMLRGGYQLTYSTPGRSAGNINYAPGIQQDLSWNGDNYVNPNTGTGYMDLAVVDDLIPVPVPEHLKTPAADPTPPIYQRQQGITVYDPNLRTPYIQRITMAVVRNIGSNMTVEVKYVGNLSRKNISGVNVNSANFFDNGLFDVFTQARRGENPVLLDQMLNGVTLVAGRTPVNGTTSRGGDMLRAYNATRGNLANGNFAGQGVE